MIKKSSFFSRITGQNDDYDDFFEDRPAEKGVVYEGGSEGRREVKEETWPEEPGGELAVDVYQTPDAIVVKALVAGVQPATIDISLTREMLTISGQRQDDREVEDDGYFQRELYWGSFSRTILLPEEVDVDMAEASEKHGILMIRLPKINKAKQTKLKVRAR